MEADKRVVEAGPFGPKADMLVDTFVNAIEGTQNFSIADATPMGPAVSVQSAA